MKIVIFSGTTEGRLLSEGFSRAGIPHIVCVATEYGETVMTPAPQAEIRQGRLSAEAMTAFFRQEAELVFDATHPYAGLVTENIRAACGEADVPYVRILRGQSCDLRAFGGLITVYDDAAACAAALKDLPGRILLTTGSKDLPVYAADPGVRERLFVRVLPAEESLRACREAGLTGKQILAMHGPFSAELNAAIIRQWEIGTMVTKESGDAGGLPGKLEAARETGIRVCLIRRPSEESGLTVTEALRRYAAVLPEAPEGAEAKAVEPMRIDLIGAGPGRETLLTAEASEAIRRAELLFGSPRLLENHAGRASHPYYRADDILPVLEAERPVRAAVLFSGDTGFYSGARKLLPAIRDWSEKTGIRTEVRVHPGISSVAYLASKTGGAYSDAGVMSLHGAGGDRQTEARLIRSVKYRENTFVLLSGAGDVRRLGQLLLEHGLGEAEVTLGLQLSYPEEEIRTLRPEECLKTEKKGLYAARIRNPHPSERRLLPVCSDEAFLRGRVPMTKEVIRHLSVLRLEPREGMVVYDIGSGTGSVAAELAGLDESVMVYAIEQKEDACGLIRQNAERLKLPNIRIVQGRAPEALEALEPPTHAFIGGSSGALREILDCLLLKNPGLRVVINAVSLETIAEIRTVLKEYDISDLTIEQVAVSRAREVGDHHLMTADNPVLLAAFRLGGAS